MARKLRRRLRRLSPEEQHLAYCRYLDQWLVGELLEYEFLARHGLLRLRGRSWETFSADEQFKALTLARESLEQARSQIQKESA